jgi:hypothetical protein
MFVPRLLLAFILPLLVVACGSDGSDAGDADAGLTPDEVELHGACELPSRLGGFSVGSGIDKEGEKKAYGQGVVMDAVVPLTVLFEERADAECRLMRRKAPFCDPDCEIGQICSLDNTCISFPSGQDMGLVNISGLLQDVEMEPLPPGNNYNASELSLPLAEPGNVVALTSSQDWKLFGIAPHELDKDDATWLVKEDTPLVIRWEAPPEEVRTEVAVKINIDQHGNSPLALHCLFEDDGEGTVSAELVNELLSAVSGYPNGSIERRTADSMESAEGCFDFTVFSAQLNEVRVDGHTPCTNDDHCPSGMTCDIPNETCI